MDNYEKPITIELANENDLPALGEVFAEVYSRFDVGESWTAETAKQLLSYWFKRSPELFYVARVEGRIVGAFVVDIKPWWDGNRAVDGEIFVHPEYQQHGVGAKLMKKVLTIAQSEYSVKSFDTCTFANKYPLNWYQKLGFKQTDDLVFITGDINTVLGNLK
jgi:ribosomal protein S18 acetylase RimI-like enzyme